MGWAEVSHDHEDSQERLGQRPRGAGRGQRGHRQGPVITGAHRQKTSVRNMSLGAIGVARGMWLLWA